jgi:hypothetical protein
MEVIRTSEILKMLTIPALGTYSNGRKFFDGNSKCFVKQNGKYKLEVDQNESDLIVVMRDVYITDSMNQPYKLVRQVKILNHRVVEKIVRVEKVVERYQEVPVTVYVDKEIHVDKIKEIPFEKIVEIPHPV